ncbi:MAG: hypothetical protein IK122_02045 [Alphaproteobacteria bacterium]|nr:hypothetical protein [Alphaproteobacteria bacterium]
MAEKNTNNYTSDYDNHKEWCQNCICFGSVPTDKHWLCSESLLEGFPEVAYCGHCDKFSSDKKINLLKYWLLKMEGFQFRNKVR